MVQTTYDIVKAHGREIKEESIEAHASKISIELPIIKI
jgi:hypothetical protein